MPYPASAMSPWKIVNDARIVAAIARIAHTDDSRPNPSPDRINVAGPVLVAYAISATGRCRALVYWSVSHLMTPASTRPVSVANEKRQSGAPVRGSVRYRALTAAKPAVAAAAATQKPLAIGRIGSPSASSRARTAHVPMIDRKSTRLNSSHVEISYAVFCLKKKKSKWRHSD